MNHSDESDHARATGASPRAYGRGRRTTFYGPQRGMGVAHLEGQRLAAQLIEMPHGPARLLLALIFDGVLSEADLRLAWQALPRAYGAPDGPTVEWKREAGGAERRILGPITVLTLQAAAKADFDAASTDLSHSLRTPGHSGGEPAGGVIPLADVLAAVSTRLYTVLSTDIYAHVVGDKSQAVLPRSCLARLASKKALVLDIPAPTRASEEVLRQIQKLGYSSRGGDADDDPTLGRLIEHATIVPKTTRDHVRQRAIMKERLEHLEPELDAASPVWRLIRMWALGLIDYGTERFPTLAPSTIEQYVHVALWPLRQAVPPGEIGPNWIAEIDWTQVAETAAGTPDLHESQRGKLCAAVDSFRYFLERTFNVAKGGRLQTAGVKARVDANFVWPHEIDTIFAWLRPRVNDRFERMLVTVFALFADPGVALRAEDIEHLHIAGAPLAEHGSYLVIDPLRRVGRGKTPAARRSVRPGLPRTQLALHGWRDLREREGAHEADLLFAAPDNPYELYERERLYSELNRLLQAATGDPSVSVHTLRHTSLTLARQEAEQGGQRGFDERSAQAGHEDTATTIYTYVHGLERLLRAQLDRFLDLQSLVERQVCALAGLPMGRLRQQRRRASLSPGIWTFWSALRAEAAEIPLESVCTGFDLRPPVPPPAPEPPAVFNPAMVLRLLTHCAEGMDADALGLRFDVAEATWRDIRQALRHWDAIHDRRIGRVTRRPSTAAVPFAKGFGHLSQPKLVPIVDRVSFSEDAARLMAVTTAWSDALFGKWIRLDDLQALRPLVDWLASAGVGAGQLIVCHDAEAEEEAMRTARRLSVPFDGGSCRTLPLSRRAGRPRFYLGFTHHSEDSDASGRPANASISVEGLNAALLAAWVWLRTRGEGETGGQT